MISTREASLAFAGALRLARFDPKGTLFFNATVTGFWNSFWIAAILAPMHIVVLALLWQARETDVSLMYFLSIGVLASAISWFAFLLAMFHIAKLSGRENRYLAFAIANNWTSLFIAALSVPVEIAELTHLLEGDMLAFAMAVSFLYRFALPWFVARHALNLSGLAAMGVVVLDLFITGAVAMVSYPMIFGNGGI